MSEELVPPKRVFRKYSIFWALAVLMVLLGVVPLFLYSKKAVATSTEYIENSLRERQLLTVQPATSHIQAILHEYYQHIEDLRSLFEIPLANKDARATHENLLTGGILDRYVNEDCLFVLYSDKEQNILFSAYPKLTPNESENLRNLVMEHLRGLPPNLAEPANSGLSFLRITSQGDLPTPTLAMTLPIRRGDTTLATVTGVYFLNKLQSSLTEYSRGEFALFVTDMQGNLVLHSDTSMAGRKDEVAKDPTVQRVISSHILPNSPANIVVRALEGDVQKTYLVSYTGLAVMDYQWILFCQVDRDNYLAPVTSLQRQSAYWIAGLILLSIVACFFTARLITKPLLEMTEVARRLSDGDFSTRANEGIRNEVGELARAINKMAKDIQVYIQAVEAKAEENNRLFMNSIRAIANAIDAKDPYTRGHSERVSDYSMIVAREFGLDERRLRIMRIASLLHDVGKIGIEDKILRKPGALTNDEFGEMKKHPPKGADILASIPEMTEMIPGIRHHHERWGGGGYPDGLRGEQIPLLARIVGVADAFDAMTTNRPYQRAMSFQLAANRVNELMNTVYDPRVVEAFNRAYQKGAFLKYQQQVQGQQVV
jgi:HD-GYP domain-containing protein (c-di-GMP phosphodiesterase class II)